MSRDPGDSDSPAFQLNEEKYVVTLAERETK
jgi:hypothetical protein